MKRSRCIKIAGMFLSLVLSVVNAKAQEGINFSEGTFNQMLTKAKAVDQLIFIDVYTTWCGPCKQMSKDVFPQKEVGRVFNSSFVNYKIDAEKGEGIKLAKTYGVNAFPTYLFVNGEGQLVYRASGSMDAMAFVELAKNAIKEKADPKPLVQWEADYSAGKRDKDFLIGYISKRSASKVASPYAIEEVFPKLSEQELASKGLLSTIYGNPDQAFVPNGQAVKYGVKNYKKIDSIMSSKYTLAIVFTGVESYFRKYTIPNKNESEMKVVRKSLTDIADELKQDHAHLNANVITWNFYAKTGNLEKSFVAASDFYNNYFIKVTPAIIARDKDKYEAFLTPYRSGAADSTKQQGWEMTKRIRKGGDMINFTYRLRDIANDIYSNSSNKQHLLAAREWARLADQYFPHFSTKAVYAGLLFKTGEKQKAIEMMNMAADDSMIASSKERRNFFTARADEFKKDIAPEKLW